MRKKKKHTSAEERYKRFIESKPCLVTGGTSIAHHVRWPGFCGMGQKPPHWWCLPLAEFPCHNKLHAIGENRFWDEEGFDPRNEIIKLLSEFAEMQHEKTIPF